MLEVRVRFLTGMLHRDEQRAIVGCKANARQFRAARPLEEQLRAGPVLAVDFADVDAFGCASSLAGTVGC